MGHGREAAAGAVKSGGEIETEKMLAYFGANIAQGLPNAALTTSPGQKKAPAT
ncbi:hypothetical protein HMPREF0004_1890 [Achromobacter piechaudii ATCC 43553]|uniref:Uncharacterized protein n=1 Tax=Achromobacter piechaudii ATCC 43553 TaxID=742159 RepID=D4X8U3_9BURK|nr:hypothetical protein HMPREF0004_1890 [Achromobacter piechaudii ATCC 43553]